MHPVWTVLCVCRYFLSRFRKVKKANGQILAINEVQISLAFTGRACSLLLSSLTVRGMLFVC
jgi:hypothetical protein